MTQEEYIKNKKALEAELDALNELFIDTNKPCPIGQKISVLDRGKRVEGIVTGYSIRYGNELKMLAKKLKKDGTPSNLDLHIWSDSDIKYP